MTPWGSTPATSLQTPLVKRSFRLFSKQSIGLRPRSQTQWQHQKPTTVLTTFRQKRSGNSPAGPAPWGHIGLIQVPTSLGLSRGLAPHAPVDRTLSVNCPRTHLGFTTCMGTSPSLSLPTWCRTTSVRVTLIQSRSRMLRRNSVIEEAVGTSRWRRQGPVFEDCWFRKRRVSGRHRQDFA